MILKRLILLTLILFVATGCSQQYVTPGEPADLNLFTVPAAKKAAAARPTASFPAYLVAVQVQQSGYRNQSTTAYGSGSYSVVTSREHSTESDLDKLRTLPGIAEVGGVNRMLLSEQLTGDEQLLQAAARLHADMVLVYTFDTAFSSDDVAPPLTLITLGLAPTKTYEITSTASGLLMDAKTGFVYGVLEDTKKRSGIATAWNDGSALENARKKAEGEALHSMLSEFKSMWGRIYERYK